MKKYKKILRGAILVSFLFFLVGCDKKDSPQPAAPSGPPANEVWMQNNTFNPASITVPRNTTVKWVNKDSYDHNVMSTGGVFSSGTINAGGTYSYRFATAGTFNYTCTLHPGMDGVVIVQ